MRSCRKKSGPGETHFVTITMTNVHSVSRGSATAQQARSMMRFQGGRGFLATLMVGVRSVEGWRAFNGWAETRRVGVIAARDRAL